MAAREGKGKKKLLEDGQNVGRILLFENKKIRKDGFGDELPANINFQENKYGEKKYVVEFQSLNLRKHFLVTRLISMKDARQNAFQFYNTYIEEHKELKKNRKRNLIGNNSQQKQRNLQQCFSTFKLTVRKPSVLTFSEWKTLVLSACYYCGRSATITSRNGVDRVDSKSNYIFENCVPCCGICNCFKGQLTLAGFLAHLRIILLHHTYQTIIPPMVLSAFNINQILHPTREMFRRIKVNDRNIYDIQNDEKTFLRYRQFVSHANSRNLECNMTFLDFKETIQKHCFYCNVYPLEANIGLDRIDSFKGYLKDNIIPSCSPCNMLKGPNTQCNFFVHCEKILERQGFIMVKKEHS